MKRKFYDCARLKQAHISTLQLHHTEGERVGLCMQLHQIKHMYKVKLLDHSMYKTILKVIVSWSEENISRELNSSK